MLEVFLLAIALSMDAFAISIGLGAKKTTVTLQLAIKAGLYFGVFQAIMPLIGYFTGVGLLSYIEVIDHWVAFFLLTFIGGKMIYESFCDGTSEEVVNITTRVMIVLAVATSIDALAAGFTLSLFDLSPLISIVLIGVTTFIFSFVGIYIGDRMGTHLESKAEFLGGSVLIVIGTKILLVHLNIY